ncbi:MAG: SIS domain-containing protein [Sciscionella sp.]
MLQGDGLDLIERDIQRQGSELRRSLPALREEAARIAGETPAPSKVYLIGCGDSFDGSTAARYAWDPLMPCAVEAAPAMTFATRMVDQAPTGSLVVALSQSGRVSRVVEAVRAARTRGLRTITITSNGGSALAVEPSDSAWVLALEKLGPVPGMTSHLLGALALYELGAALATDRPASAHLRADIDLVPDLVERSTEIAWPVAFAHAERFERALPVLALGYGPCLGSARFTVRKILELAQITAISQETEEYAHDEYSLVDSRFRVVLFAPPDRGRARSLEVAGYLRRLGVDLAIVAEDGTLEERHGTDVVYDLLAMPLSMTPLVYAVPGQILSLAVARHVGGSLYGAEDPVHEQDGDPQIYASGIVVP